MVDSIRRASNVWTPVVIMQIEHKSHSRTLASILSCMAYHARMTEADVVRLCTGRAAPKIIEAFFLMPHSHRIAHPKSSAKRASPHIPYSAM